MINLDLKIKNEKPFEYQSDNLSVIQLFHENGTQQISRLLNKQLWPFQHLQSRLKNLKFASLSLIQINLSIKKCKIIKIQPTC